MAEANTAHVAAGTYSEDQARHELGDMREEVAAHARFLAELEPGVRARARRRLLARVPHELRADIDDVFAQAAADLTAAAMLTRSVRTRSSRTRRPDRRERASASDDEGEPASPSELPHGLSEDSSTCESAACGDLSAHDSFHPGDREPRLDREPLTDRERRLIAFVVDAWLEDWWKQNSPG